MIQMCTNKRDNLLNRIRKPHHLVELIVSLPRTRAVMYTGVCMGMHACVTLFKMFRSLSPQTLTPSPNSLSSTPVSSHPITFPSAVPSREVLKSMILSLSVLVDIVPLAAYHHHFCSFPARGSPIAILSVSRWEMP